MQVFEPIVFPSGLLLNNRIIKAAMEENMATQMQQPGMDILNLYYAWAKGEMGAIITGNVMVDPEAMTGPGGIALHAQSDLKPFADWAKLSKEHGVKIIMQINHPGRQTYKSLEGKTIAPSSTPLELGKHSSMFAQPKEMTEADIQDVIARFTTTAKKAEEAGFDGVEIHAAHGYLLSQFLSPLVNKRNDKWGGEILNRSRLLLEIVHSVKTAVSSKFSVSVKLNSADFQRGGFDINDAIFVVQQLEETNIDFVELSGGSYEAPAMQGRSADEKTLAREAYFLEFAKSIASQTKLKIMTTGGIRRLPVANLVVSEHIDLVGIASAMAYQSDLVKVWKTNPEAVGFTPKVNWKNKTLAALATMALVRRQLQRVGKLKATKQDASPLFSLIQDRWRLARLTKRYKKHMLGKS
ncbi:MAG: 2,4-dienoyl-CoA reductase-like NADH-dependent reductase (Old Yellow Enzyme family) [Glaciecola sp.]|jgi:2,4-dienoyl-CoA reductase-like NADH-dependent reductase (Old Yellow Enzyme family)